MKKKNKTFKLAPQTIATINEVAGMLEISQAEVISRAITSAFGREEIEQRLIESLRGNLLDAIQQLEALRDHEGQLTEKQEKLTAFLNETFDKAKTF